MKSCFLSLLFVCLALTTALPTQHIISTESLASIVDSVKETVLMAVTSESDSGDASANLLPILGLVEGMLEQTKNVSIAEIALQGEVGAEDKRVEDEERSKLNHLKDLLTGLTLRFDVLTREKEDAEVLMETKQAQVMEWESQVLSFESECMAPVGALQKEVQHITRDLGLLDLLHQRLHEIINNNNQTTIGSQINIQFLLQQVQTISRQQPNLLEQNTAETEGTNLDKIKNLLIKLTDELNGVVVSRQKTIMEFRTNCSNMEAKLNTQITQGKELIENNTKIVQDRTVEINDVKANQTTIQTNITNSEHRLQKHLESVSNHDRITDGLVRHRQAVLMILSQMRQLLRNYISRLDSLPSGDVSQDSNTTAKNVALFETQAPQPHKQQQQHASRPQNVILMADNDDNDL